MPEDVKENPAIVTEELRDKHKAEAEKHRADARKANAEAAKFEAEAESKRYEASNDAIRNREKVREEKEALSKNKHHHVYHLTESIDTDSVKKCIEQLDIWRRTSIEGEPKKLEIIFTSPGGSIIDGFVLYDYIKMVQSEGWEVNTGTLGMAASMAGILLQAGNTRWMSRESWVLIHQASFGVMGKMGQVEDTVAWLKRIQERILDIFANRAAAVKNKGVKPLRNKLKKNWERRDWWLSSEECLEWGFIDEIR